MNKKLLLGLFFFVLLLLGCGGVKPNDDVSSAYGGENINDEVLNIDEEIIAGLAGMSNIDNSKDAFSRTEYFMFYDENSERKIYLPQLVKSGLADSIGTENESEYKREGFLYFDCDGNGSKRSISGEGKLNSLKGTKLGSDLLVVSDKFNVSIEQDGAQAECQLVDLDSNIINQFSLDLTKTTGKYFDIYDIFLDVQDCIHVRMASSEDKDSLLYPNLYCVFSKDGQLIYQYSTKDDEWIASFHKIYDGKIALSITPKEGESYKRIAVYNNDTDEMNETDKIKWFDSQNPGDHWFEGITMPDSKNVIYGSVSGLYKLNLETKEKETLYKWSLHGVSISQIYDMEYSGEMLRLVIESKSGCHYLQLEPTVKEVEVKDITLVTTAYRAEKYRQAATIFNRLYPAYNIVIEEDPEELPLLTKLIAGEGPVLIDSGLVGFEEHEDLWQPLGNIFDQLNLTDDLVPQTIDYGSINGKLYGITIDFSVQTVVINDNSIESWNYSGFNDYIANHQNVKALTNNDDYSGNSNILFLYYLHGMNDNYFIDFENQNTVFKEKEFTKMMEDIPFPYYLKEELVRGEPLLNGEVLCNHISISSPRDMTMYRILYGEDINYIGFPNNTGVGHYVSGTNPLCIRSTASIEEKQAALAYINIILSYDCQREIAGDITSMFSVRKDVLEEQFSMVDEGTLLYLPNGESLKIGKYLDKEKDYKAFLSILENAQRESVLSPELMDILREEFDAYFNGTLDKKELISHLDNRVGLYLGEMY
ncbi:MAG: ABC transporter substrate-binding protein [Lachnospiraceae bacterium]|nr:ABC transporter substrate-binding protein [Lachnospiraceae bacterium]